MARIPLLLAILGMVILSTTYGSSIDIDNAQSKGVGGWNKTFNGPGGGLTWAYSVQPTSDGGYIVVGETEPHLFGDTDAWLMKTDSNGNRLWDKTFGGEGWDRAESVQLTSDGGYIIAGWTYSYGEGKQDAWLIKTDSDGNKLWDRTFGGSGNDWANSVQPTSDGGYIVTGWTSSYSTGMDDIWLIKTDSNGNKLWDRIFGGPGYDRAYSVQPTSDGGYIVVGETESYGAGDWDVWLIKTDANGNKLWDKTFGSGGWDSAESVQPTSDGGYIIAGWIYRNSNDDVWLIKTDANGSKLWDKTFGGLGGDRAYSIQQTNDGGYIVVGETDGEAKSEVLTSSMIWLIKTDSDGNTLWDKTFSRSGWDRAFSIQLTSDGGYILAGWTYYAGYNNAWLIKIDAYGNV